jgi:putative FmdB family regulatory protein
MPTYEYVCPDGHEFERFLKMNDRTRVKCPECGRVARRRISGGAGLHFKGSGFYITDYGKDGKGPRKPPAEDRGTKADSSESAPAPAKSEAKSSGKKAAE